MRNRAELEEFLNDQQPHFVEDFEVLLRAAHKAEDGMIRAHLESLWARYNMLLALAERFARRADASAEETLRYVREEIDRKIEG